MSGWSEPRPKPKSVMSWWTAVCYGGGTIWFSGAKDDPNGCSPTAATANEAKWILQLCCGAHVRHGSPAGSLGPRVVFLTAEEGERSGGGDAQGSSRRRSTSGRVCSRVRKFACQSRAEFTPQFSDADAEQLRREIPLQLFVLVCTAFSFFQDFVHRFSADFCSIFLPFCTCPHVARCETPQAPQADQTGAPPLVPWFRPEFWPAVHCNSGGGGPFEPVSLVLRPFSLDSGPGPPKASHDV